MINIVIINICINLNFLDEAFLRTALGVAVACLSFSPYSLLLGGRHCCLRYFGDYLLILGILFMVMVMVLLSEDRH